MADEEQKHNDGSATSTPSSSAPQQGGLKAPKDRQCPFCSQAFTSSSLGRHLDLYIKPKNPKPPDGVHDVVEIRKIRGGITRRQARTSLKASASRDGTRRGSSGTPNVSGHKVGHTRDTSRFTEGSPVVSPTDLKDNEPRHGFINAANWQATGVINNIPPRAASRTGTPSGGQADRIQQMRRDASGKKVQRPDYDDEQMWKLQEQAEVGRAAEMALREVLGSLEAARKKEQPKTLYPEFDFFALSFAGLCLAMLPAPTTLFSSAPFPSADSWMLQPPGQKQFEVLNRRLIDRLRDRGGTLQESVSIPDSAVFKHQSHLQGAYEHWRLMSKSDQQSTWTLEILRAYSRERDANATLKADLEQSEQHARHLEAQYDRLSRCQLPREWLLHPPNTVHVPSSLKPNLSDLTSGAADPDIAFDADVLLNKWKTVVQRVARPTRAPPIGEKTHSSLETYERDHSSRIAGGRRLHEDVLLNGAMFAINGPLPRETDESSGQRNSNHDTVMYETPPNPGAVVGAAEDGETANNSDAEDLDADGEEDDPGSFGSYVDHGALEKQKQFVSSAQNSSWSEPALNGNGKRPLHSNTMSGRPNKSARVLREHRSSLNASTDF